MHVHPCLLRLLLLHLLVFAPLPHLMLCLLLLYMRALHPYTIRVQTRYRIRCWSSGAQKVRWRSTVENRSVVQTVDMSPAPDAGTYRRSADKVHDQRQVSRKRQAESSGGSGPRCGHSRDSLLFGDATWASPTCTAITRVGVGLWYREVGSLGAKG